MILMETGRREFEPILSGIEWYLYLPSVLSADMLIQ